MDTRVAIIAIVVEDAEQVEKLNGILHEYSKFIVGRMGIPYQKRNISLISVMVDGPANVISAISGKIGMLNGVSAKAVYSRLTSEEQG